MIQELCNIRYFFTHSAFSILICIASNSVAIAQSIVILKAEQGNITYHLMDDSSDSCPSTPPNRVLKSGMTVELDLKDFIAICTSPGGQASVINCPDPISPTKKTRAYYFTGSYSTIITKCSLSNVHGPGDTVLGGWDTSIPYIISPRRTKVLRNKSIVLRWNPTSENLSYAVAIKPDKTAWSGSKTISSGGRNKVVEIPGPKDLEPGIYRFIVTDNNGKSSDRELEDDKNSVLQFRVVSKTEENEIESEVQGLKDTLDVARAYAEKGFYLEAIQTLEGMSEDKKNSTTYAFLGNFYSAVGLSVSAVENYHRSKTEYAQRKATEICEKFKQKNSNQSLPGCSN
jgi:hypothetical protein